MKVTVSLVALATVLFPSALGAQHALYFTTHEPDWVAEGPNRQLGYVPELFPGKLTVVPADGSPLDVQLVDGEGKRLNVVAGLISASWYPEQSAMIDLGGKNGEIQCHAKRLWEDERFNVGAINIIFSPGDEPQTFKSEIRRARSTGKAGILDPTRFQIDCSYTVPPHL